MEPIKFELKTEYIELIKLLKLLRLVESGGQAKMAVEEGLVFRNEEKEPELRKRAKIRKGEHITFQGQEIQII